MRDFPFEILLTSYRNYYHRTQQEVANGVGVSLRTYVKWEKGDIPKEEMLRRLASFFGLTEAEANELYRSAAHTPPEIENLPFPKNRFFTSRETQLKQLNQHFQENGNAVIALQRIHQDNQPGCPANSGTAVGA